MPPERRNSARPNLGTLAAAMIAARKASGHTQESLALATGLHRTEISLIERMGREPRIGTILKYADSTGVTLDALCSGIRWVPTRPAGPGLIVPGHWIERPGGSE